MTDVLDSPVMSVAIGDATLQNGGLNSPVLSRHVSLPMSPTDSRAPSLLRPTSSLPSIAVVLTRGQGLDAAMKKLQAGLSTRTGDYCKRVLNCTQQLQQQWATRHTRRATTPSGPNDILDFSGVPYSSPVEPDLPPVSPSNNSLPSPSQSATSPAASPLSPAPFQRAGTMFLSPNNRTFNTASHSYISDLCIHQKLNKKSAPPADYTPVERTISGQHRAQVNRNNNSIKVNIAYKRSTLPTAPITSVAVFFRDIKEEAPFNFTAVERNTAGGDGCLHPGSTGRQPYLALCRGEGAPLTHISLISRQYKEVLPAGWHEVKVTLSGDRKADISGGSSEGAMYVCFRVDVRPVMNRWRIALDDFSKLTPKSKKDHSATIASDSHHSSSLMSPSSSSATSDPDDDEQLLFPYYARLLALLSSLLYSYDGKLILFTFEVYRKLQSQHIPPQLLNLFLSCVCDATPLFLTYFQSSQHAALLKWLMSAFKANLPVLSVDVLIKCVEVCLLLRHEDKQLEVSEAMITRVLDSVTDIHTGCYCQQKATAGGADGDDSKDSGANTPAVPQSPSSNNSNTSMFTTAANTQLCYHCAQKHYNALQSVPQLAQSVLRQLTTNIANQHALSSHVRSYRRHHNITPHFRSDVREIINQLIALDEPAIRQRRAVQGMLGSLGIGGGGGGGGGGGDGGRGKLSFSSVRAGEIAPEVKEETEEGVRVEEALSSAETSRNNTPPPGAIGSITINLDTPSRLPSQEHNTTLINDRSRTPSPTETKEERELNGGNGGGYLLPPVRRGSGSGEEETSMSYSGSGSQSEFLYPEFHEEEALTPTPVQEVDEEDDSGDEETKTAEVDDDAEPGSSPLDAPMYIAPSISVAAAEERDGPVALSTQTNHQTGNGSQPNVSPSTFNVFATSSPSSPVSSFYHTPAFAFPGPHVAATVDVEPSPRAAELHLFAMVLTYCKAATEQAQFGLRDSETLRRKQHALRLLLNVLHHSRFYFRSHLSASLLLRRFVMTSLMSASVTDNMAIFRLVLQAFSLVSERYKSEVMIELGTVMDFVFAGFLSTPYIAAQQKTAIVEVLLLSMLKSASSVINLYYNYDNNARSWGLFQRLVDVLANIVEGGESKSGAAHGAAAGAVVTPPSESELDENGDKVESTLQRQALKLLVHLLHMQAQWIGVPGLNRPSNGPARLLQPNTALTERASSLAPPVPYRGRRPSWSSRFEDQKKQSETLKKAIRLAQTDSLKSALGFYRLANPANAQPMEMAKFLYRNDSLDKVEVGDFLSSTTDKFMKHEQYEELRRCYISLLDFTGLTLDQALRTFLSDSGFRLPGEAQKIDRLLSAFSSQYVLDNPSAVSNADAAYTLTFALVMLNTDAHNPNLDQKKNNNRRRMTEDDFIRNLRGMNSGENFDREYLLQMYYGIVQHEIKMLDSKTKPPLLTQATKRSLLDDAGKSAFEHKALVRKSYEVPVRKALAYCKTHVSDTHNFMLTDDANIVRGMYDACWYRALKALETRSDNAGSDVELLHICLDGIAYGAIIGILLGMNEQRDAYTKQLAKVVFIEKCNQDPNKRQETSSRLAKEEHLKQEWYRRAGYDAQHHPTDACKSVFFQLNSVKHTINVERQQATLKRVENDFGGEIVLADPYRALVKEGPLTKVSNDGRKRTIYHFMLFNDLILYASHSGSAATARYKVHRVVHLSLCRLEDVRSTAYPYAFRIVSPQKSFLVLADSSEKKQRWLDAILANLRDVMQKRKKYIEEARKKEGETEEKTGSHAQLPPTPAGKQTNGTSTASAASSATNSAASSPTSPSRRDMLRISSSMDFNAGREGTLRRYSTFIGQSDLDLNSRLTKATGDGSVTHCKLCIRPFNSLFKRKQRCKWCQDIICQDCCKNKAKLPGTGGKVAQVCDACFGALSGMVGEDVQLLTIKEENGLSAAAAQPAHGGGAAGAKEKSAADLERARREERRRTT